MNPKLIKKYNVPGPRYTSYPTVPFWDHSPTKEEWLSSLSSTLAKSPGAAIYIHIPFCESLCSYCGCNTRITKNLNVGTPYVETVLKEFELYRTELSLHSSPIKISELHLGGGTPTFLKPETLSHLIENILKNTNLDTKHEFSIEVDPRVTSENHIRTLSSLGFSRISMGIQSLDLKVQKAVNRVQSLEQIKKLTYLTRSHGFESVNYDLIYGLPHQTLDGIKKTIEAVCRIKPDRIAFYAYAHVPWIKPSHRKYTEEDLPTGETKRRLYEEGRNLLEKAGYHEIGMDHFALESDSLWKSLKSGELHRNFMGYIAKECYPLLGLGVSSIGDSISVFMQNEKQLERYQKRVSNNEIPILRGHVLNPEDLILRGHILRLMTQMKTSWSDKNRFVEYLNSLPENLKELERDGLVRITPTSCEVTEPGRAFLRNICMAFDARLRRKTPETRLFSQTV